MKRFWGIALLSVLTLVILLSFFFPASGGYDHDGSIRRGGEWFLKNQDDSFVCYEYDIVLRSCTPKSHVLREMASLWSVTLLADYLQDERYANLSLIGFSYFEKHLVKDKRGFILVNATKGDIKLAHSAFLILALINMKHPKKDYYIGELSDGILFQQNEDGSFRTLFNSNSAGGEDYYPGEALFALMSVYQYNNDTRYLLAADKALPYYIGYWEKNENIAFVPWQTRAWKMYYDATNSTKAKDFVFEMNDLVIDRHSLGCRFFMFYGPPTSVYIEGVIKAYELAKEVNDTERMDCYARFVREGSDYIISMQVKDTPLVADEAVGGFSGTAFDRTIRSDRVQHGVVALIDAINAGIIEPAR